MRHSLATWEQAGHFDAAHGLMPMAFGAIPEGRCSVAYVSGYRAGGRLGIGPNPYRDARRPKRAPQAQIPPQSRWH